jgi:ribosomal RNA-processing protein 12
MIRKFGYDAVYKNAPEGGERKVLENIKRRKDRAKRKKAAAENGGDDDDEGKPKQSSGNAFDDILYNSDSDLESDGEEESRPVKPLSKRQRKAAAAAAAAGQTFIRNEGDDPMDLLSRSIAGGVTRADPTAASRKRKPGQDAAHFKTDRSGKLVIEESGDEDDEMDGRRATGEGNAYMAAMHGADGATRDARGGLKFNKNTKRAREAEREEEAMMDLDELIGDKKPKKAKKKAVKLGEEFRSKRGKGDVKRNDGPDPFSYVPIGQAAARKDRGGQRVNLTNKKKGSRA